jgi:hypothetical protein
MLPAIPLALLGLPIAISVYPSEEGRIVDAPLVASTTGSLGDVKGAVRSGLALDRVADADVAVPFGPRMTRPGEYILCCDDEASEREPSDAGDTSQGTN